MDLLDQLFRWLGFARYNATQPTVVDGAVSELQCDARGNLRVVDVDAQSARKQLAVTPSDAADLPGGVARGVYVGTGGTIALLLVDDTVPVTWVNVGDGALIGAAVKRVYATGTTASNIIALY